MFAVEFATYLQYCRRLKFDETPDYIYLKRLFRELFTRLNYQSDCEFDWVKIVRSPMSCDMLKKCVMCSTYV